MATTPDSRSTSNPGESRNDHFGDAAQLARMGQVFSNRRQDDLDGVRDDYDQDY